MSRVLALALALLGAAHAAAAQDFRSAVQRVAAAWERGDASALGEQSAQGGLAIDIGGERIGPLGGRQATTALRRLFDDRESVSTRVGMHREVGGQPRRGFAELNWVTKMRGTSEPQRSTVVLTFELEKERWRITEIRLLR